MKLAELIHCKTTGGWASHTHEFTFQTPTQYYEFRKAWAENYNAITQKIRNAKKTRKTSWSNYDPNSGSILYYGRHEARIEMNRLAEAIEAGKRKKAQKVVTG